MRESVLIAARSFFCVLLVLVWSQLAHADQPLVLTDETQIKLGNAFIEQGEYYRAITEFKRLLILFPDSPWADHAALAVGICYFKGGEYANAIKSLESFRATFPDSPLLPKSAYFEGLSLWKAFRYDSAESRFALVAEEGPQSEYGSLALVTLSLVSFDQGRPQVAAEYLRAFLKEHGTHTYAERVRSALTLIDQYASLPHKSPALAATLSAILPGAGYVYVGHQGDGLMAFLVNLLFAAGSAAGFQAENMALGVIVGGVGVPFYLGNVWGSANAAKKRNKDAQEQLRARIVQELDFIY